MVEAAWKSHEWDAVRRHLELPSMVAQQEGGSPRHKLFEVALAVVVVEGSVARRGRRIFLAASPPCFYHESARAVLARARQR